MAHGPIIRQFVHENYPRFTENGLFTVNMPEKTGRGGVTAPASAETRAATSDPIALAASAQVESGECVS